MATTGSERPAPRRGGVQSIARAGRLLRALENAPAGLTLPELAAAVDLPKSTAHRLLGALADEELVSTGEGGRITLGGGVARLAAAGRATLPQRLRPVLERAHRQLDETIDLALLDGRAMLFVDQLTALHRLRAVSSVGVSFPLYCTANGKALLAALTPAQAAVLLPARLAPRTPATITSRARLLGELEEVRRRGVAVDREEHTAGICAVGAAILDATGPVAALSVPVPTPRFGGREEIYASAVRAAAQDASQLLGGTATRHAAAGGS